MPSSFFVSQIKKGRLFTLTVKPMLKCFVKTLLNRWPMAINMTKIVFKVLFVLYLKGLYLFYAFMYYLIAYASMNKL